MGRYKKRIEVKDPKSLIVKVVDYLTRNGFRIEYRNDEKVWAKDYALDCRHFIITDFEADAIKITAFITYMAQGAFWTKYEREAGIRSYFGGMYKWPLWKIVRRLQKMIRENKDIVQSEIGVDGIPEIFKSKYPYDAKIELAEVIARFNREFGLEKFALPRGFKEFSNSDKWYHISDDLLDISPVKYENILSFAYDLLYGSDVYNIPPSCIPFATDESGHETYVLDYRECGKKGEPRVFAVDNERDILCADNEDIVTYTFGSNVIAKDFDEFLKMCKFEMPAGVEIKELLQKLKNADIEDVEIAPADKDFSAEACQSKYPFLPDDYIAFLTKCNGISSNTFYACGFSENFGIDAPSVEHKQQYLDAYGKDYKAEDWFFFGGDGMGGEYAFPTDAIHETVYYFDHEFPDTLIERGSFTEFLEEEIDTLIEISD